MTKNIEDNAKNLLQEAADGKLSYVNAYIKDGVCNTFITGQSREEVLRCLSHILAQIIIESELEKEEVEAIYGLAADYILEQAELILNLVYSEESFN